MRSPRAGGGVQAEYAAGRPADQGGSTTGCLDYRGQVLHLALRRIRQGGAAVASAPGVVAVHGEVLGEQAGKAGQACAVLGDSVDDDYGVTASGPFVRGSASRRLT
jgi:hypothetical protein